MYPYSPRPWEHCSFRASATKQATPPKVSTVRRHRLNHLSEPCFLSVAPLCTICGYRERVKSTGSESETTGLPSWLQSRMTQILANVTLKIDNLVFKYVHSDVVVSVALRVRPPVIMPHAAVSECVICSSVFLTPHRQYFELKSADPHKGWTAAFQGLADARQTLHKVGESRHLCLCVRATYSHGDVG